MNTNFICKLLHIFLHNNFISSVSILALSAKLPQKYDRMSLTIAIYIRNFASLLLFVRVYFLISKYLLKFTQFVLQFFSYFHNNSHIKREKYLNFPINWAFITSYSWCSTYFITCFTLYLEIESVI